jgi:hypothetical protein
MKHVLRSAAAEYKIYRIFNCAVLLHLWRKTHALYRLNNSDPVDMELQKTAAVIDLNLNP